MLQNILFRIHEMKESKNQEKKYTTVFNIDNNNGCF